MRTLRARETNEGRPRVSRQSALGLSALGLSALGLSALALTASACGGPLPADIDGYRDRCARMNATLIAPYGGDPHAGFKNVYACGVDDAALRANTRPFPDGTLIVKESTRAGERVPWLIALARKERGTWRWDEYTRNFEDEDFRHGLAGQSVCTGCHTRAQSLDWIFTFFSRP